MFVFCDSWIHLPLLYRLAKNTINTTMESWVSVSVNRKRLRFRSVSSSEPVQRAHLVLQGPVKLHIKKIGEQSYWEQKQPTVQGKGHPGRPKGNTEDPNWQESPHHWACDDESERRTKICDMKPTSVITTTLSVPREPTSSIRTLSYVCTTVGSSWIVIKLILERWPVYCMKNCTVLNHITVCTILRGERVLSDGTGWTRKRRFLANQN